MQRMRPWNASNRGQPADVVSGQGMDCSGRIVLGAPPQNLSPTRGKMGFEDQMVMGQGTLHGLLE